MKQKAVCELLGTMFLVMVVLGSGTMAEKLFQGQAGLALLANSLATGAGLFVLIQTLGPISGAHMNPVVSLVELLWKRLSTQEFLLYVVSQLTGAYLGILIVHGMFGLPIFQVSEIERSGFNLLFSEVIATFGLICVVALAGKKHVELAPISVAAYITSAYWFTSSTSFANPAVTFARTFTNTFGGMSAHHLIGFVVAQIVGTVSAWFFLRPLK